MNQIINPQVEQPKFKPAYQVEVLQGEVEVERCTFDADGAIVKVKQMEPAGYMVHFFKGHSIRVKDIKGLEELGLGSATVSLIRESGESVYDEADVSGMRVAAVMEKGDKSSLRDQIEKVVN